MGKESTDSARSDNTKITEKLRITKNPVACSIKRRSSISLSPSYRRIMIIKDTRTAEKDDQSADIFRSIEGF